MIKTFNKNTLEVKEISEHELWDKLWWEWCWGWMQASKENPWLTLDEYRANEWHSLTLEYELLQERMQRRFLSIYYPDWTYEDGYSIGKDSNWKVSPSWPFDLWEWTYYRDINNIRTALYNKIPRDIVLERYNKHQDYTNEETYWSINLYHFRRSNYDKEKYNEEKKQDLAISQERTLQASYALDEAMWVEKWTSIKAIRKNIDLAIDWTKW